MSKSKNDIEYMGGQMRVGVVAVKFGGRATASPINPKTGAPYKYGEMLVDLQAICDDNPRVKPIVEKNLMKIAEEAALHPQKIIRYYATAETKNEAQRKMMEEVLPQHREFYRVLWADRWKIDVEMGNVTIHQYVYYFRESIFIGADAGRQEILQSALNHYILPVVGEIRLKEFDKDCQIKAIRAINRKLNGLKRQSTTRYNIKEAYRALFAQIGESYKFPLTPRKLAEMIDMTSIRNADILNAFRCGHLDTAGRERLFDLVMGEENHYHALLVGLIYAGLDTDEIAELQFKDIRVAVTKSGEEIYSMVVDRIAHQASVKCGSIKASTESFNLDQLRVVVLPLYVREIVDLYIGELRQQGITEQQIAEMRFGSRTAKGERSKPKDLDAEIQMLLQSAEIPDVQLVRTDKDGKSRPQRLHPDKNLLRKDAQFVAQQYAGADPIMLHATFGQKLSETDERAYLDLRSDEYTIARYYRLRRFTPIALRTRRVNQDENCLMRSDGRRGLYTLQVTNDTGETQKLELHSDLAINIVWEEK